MKEEIITNLDSPRQLEKLYSDNKKIFNKELLFIIIAAVVAGVLAKIPEFTSLSTEYFFTRNVAFIVFPLMTAYFLWKQKSKTIHVVVCSAAILLSALYINLLPDNNESQTFILACIHLPLFLWIVLGYSFVGNNLKDHQRRLDFLRFDGDLTVMATIILIAGAILTVLTLMLFQLIEKDIEDFYFVIC